MDNGLWAESESESEEESEEMGSGMDEWRERGVGELNVNGGISMTMSVDFGIGRGCA